MQFYCVFLFMFSEKNINFAFPLKVCSFAADLFNQ